MQLTGTFADSLPGLWLPHTPLAGDSKAGSYQRMKRELALQLPYIEANPTCLQSLVIVDHDGADAADMAALVGLPAPSYVALNPHTNAGHITYALAAPVCLTDSGHRKPVNLLARIESGLTTILGGDVAYGGRITKNPYHQDHLPIWGAQNATYGLLELRNALDTLGALPKWDEKQSLANSALGRNVALFDTTRYWAYRAWTRYTDRTEWEETVLAYAWNKNLGPIADTFTRGPLELQEVTHLARSIARWVWRSDNRAKGAEQFETDFHEIQKRRGRKGGLATVAKIRQSGISEAQREANRIRATKLDPSYALEVLT